MKKMAEKFYVYEHIRPDTGAVFYVGKGRGDRAYKLYRHYSKYYTNIIAKLTRLGFQVEVRFVERHLTEEAAFTLEKKLIAQYGRHDLGLGPLANCTDGGEGVSGWPRTDEWRKQVGLRAKGNKYALGLRHTEEHKQQMSKLHRERQANGGYTLGRELSSEHRAKLRSAIANREDKERERLSEIRRKSMLGNKHTLGHKLSEEHKAKISAALKGNPKLKIFGRKPSAETRAKLSAAKKGKLADVCRRNGIAGREKLGARNKKFKWALGLKRSPETLAKMREAQIARRMRERQQIEECV